jgi:hypothetical protein
MPKRIFAAVAAVLLVLLAGGALGTYAYRAGVAEGLAVAGKLPEVAAPYAYHPHHWHGPFFFGGPLLFLLFFFLLFGVLRRALWGGHWRHGYGACGTGVPPRFEEWHRRAHESMGPDVTKV